MRKKKDAFGLDGVRWRWTSELAVREARNDALSS